MKNKKGFTLVELLAVIAILAVILLLIVPNIVNMFTNGKKDSFIRQIQSVWREAEKEYGAALTVEEENPFFCDSSSSSLGCLTLSINQTDIKYITHLDSHGKIESIGVSDRDYCYFISNPTTMEIDRDDLVKKGELTCTNSVCSCGEGTYSGNISNGTVGGNTSGNGGQINQPVSNLNGYVYWDYNLFYSYFAENGLDYQDFTFDSYPKNALTSYDSLDDVFVRTKKSGDAALSHELCAKYQGRVLCIFQDYALPNKEDTLVKLRNDAITLFGTDEVECETYGGDGTSYQGASCSYDDIFISADTDTGGYVWFSESNGHYINICDNYFYIGDDD